VVLAQTPLLILHVLLVGAAIHNLGKVLIKIGLFVVL
jgi:hypothetical protein